jgi:hypothetical protein
MQIKFEEADLDPEIRDRLPRKFRGITITITEAELQLSFAGSPNIAETLDLEMAGLMGSLWVLNGIDPETGVIRLGMAAGTAKAIKARREL